MVLKQYIKFCYKFYQVQYSMLYSNKRKSRTNKNLCQSFQPSDFIELQTRPEQQRSPKKHFCSSDKQNIAKEILIQIGQSQLFLEDRKISKTVPLPIDSWVTGSGRKNQTSRIYRQRDRERDRLFQRNFMYVRNVRSVTAGFIKSKQENEQNNVMKLKQALKKLQSPQKTKTNTKKSPKTNKNEMLQSLISKRRIETKVSDLIKLKECQNLKANGSSNHFHTRKISTSMQNRSRRQELIMYPSEPLDARKMNQLFNFNYNYKQARKNRTLKGLLS